jgi:hypothetical protein
MPGELAPVPRRIANLHFGARFGDRRGGKRLSWRLGRRSDLISMGATSNQA